MNQLTVFKVLTYLLIPVALLFGLIDIFMLIMALSNPSILLVVFAIACFVIYLFATLKFLLNGIAINKECKSSLKDWIKVNAYVTLFLSIMFLMNSSATLFIDENTLRKTLGEMMGQQAELAGKISLDFFVKMFRIISGTMLVISAFTVVHVSICFRLLKRYQHLFINE